MFDRQLLWVKLRQILDALERIQRRFAGISSPDDFLDQIRGLICWTVLR